MALLVGLNIPVKLMQPEQLPSPFECIIGIVKSQPALFNEPIKHFTLNHEVAVSPPGERTSTFLFKIAYQTWDRNDETILHAHSIEVLAAKNLKKTKDSITVIKHLCHSAYVNFYYQLKDYYSETLLNNSIHSHFLKSCNSNFSDVVLQVFTKLERRRF